MNRSTTFTAAAAKAIAGATPHSLNVSANRPRIFSGAILALDLGTTTGWALGQATSNATPSATPQATGQDPSNAAGPLLTHGWVSFKPHRFEGGGMRFLRFTQWLNEAAKTAVAQDPQNGLGAVYFEEVRRHLGVDAAHVYGGFLATLTGWCERIGVPYQGVPVGTIKRHATGKGNATKAMVIDAMRGKGFAVKDDNDADALALLHWAMEQASQEVCHA
jgi:hypothetical protein